jgi:chromosome segregation ATPase
VQYNSKKGGSATIEVLAIYLQAAAKGMEQIDESIARYLSQLESADRQEEAVPEAKITRVNEKIATLRQEIQRLSEHRRHQLRPANFAVDTR